MKQLVAMFAGQGAQKSGMGREIFPLYPELMREASKILGYSIEDLCVGPNSHLLDQTQYTQPALYVVGALLWLEYTKAGKPLPQLMIGHSLGEYMALFAAGAFTFGEGLRIVKKRAELMAQAKGGGMMAVVDLRPEELATLIESSGNREVMIANYNSPRQTIVAGTLSGLDALKTRLQLQGKGRMFPLQVSGAFHSPWMESAYDEFRGFLSAFSFQNPSIPVLSQNNCQTFTAENAAQHLADQLIKPLRFQMCIESLLDQGFSHFEEFGPRQTLSKFVAEIKQTYQSRTRIENVKLAGNLMQSVQSPFALDMGEETLLDLLKAKAQGQGATVALSFITYENEQRTIRDLTFAELDAHAERLAAHLQHKGLKKGDRVIIFGTNSIDNLIAIFGAVYAGAIFTLLPPPIDAAKQEFFRSVLNATKARFILSSGFVVDKLDAKMTDGPLPRWLMRKLIKLLKNLELIAVDRIPDQKAWRRPELNADDLLYLQYSSGSTQAPKGVMISHRNFIANSLSLKIGNAPRLSHLDKFRVLIWAPIFHNTGLLGIFQFLFQPAQVYVMSPLAFIEKPLRWFEAMTDYSINVINAPNSIYEVCASLIKDKDLQNINLSSLCVAGCGAEPVYAETLDKFAKKFGPAGFKSEIFAIGYGLAESTCMVTISAPGGMSTAVDVEQLRQSQFVPVSRHHPQAKVLVHVGAPAAGMTVVIVDPETLTPLGGGQIGEVWISGVSLARGYWQNWEMSQAAFGHRLPGYEGTFLRTGDLGSIYQGQLYITGRQKEMMIVNGHNVFPGDVEQAIKKNLKHTAILRVVTFSVVREKTEKVVVCIEMAKGFSGNFKLFADAISVDLLKEFGFTPFDIVFVEELTLPRTNTGKVQILKSKELYEKDAIPGLYRTRGVAAPQVPNTSTLRQQDQNSSIHAGGDQELFEFLVSEVRKINHALVLKRETPIHDLGLDSLTLNYLQAEIAARFKVDLDPTLFFACKTVQELMDQVMAVGATGGVSSSRTTSQPKAASEAIAIIGVSVQLPGSQDPDEFWEHLKNAKDLITEIPKERWDWQAQAEAHPEFADRLKWGGFIEGVDQFDHNFFGISPKEASLMDPQQRLLLQTAWRTMESAGYRASALKGRPLGVYVGASTQDYANLVQASQDRVHPFSVTGNAKNMLSNRISHFFDFTGPSEVIDTACSSSLVALHRAVRAIRAGECEMALAGGINLLLIPDIHLALSQAGMLSPEGRCKTFDAQAQGYVRSEGVGLYLLKPLSQAEKDNDHVLGVILGSAVNHGGRAASLTAPDRNAQTRLLLEAWRDAGIRPGDLDYIETHGTGTSLGDPIEVGAIKQAMAQDESMPSQSVCYLGAVKTICGHLEAAAGVAGLAKVLLSLENGWIPPSLHLRETNSLLKLEGSRLKIASNGMAWPAASGYDHRPRIAGISSFGFGGSNAHLVVSEYRRATRDQVIHQDESPAVILLSANSETALEARVQSLLKFLRSEAGHAVDVHQLAKNLYFGRESFRFRLALEATHCHELIGKLETWNQSKRSQPILQLETKASTDPILFAAISRWVHGEDVALDSHFGSPAYKKLRLPTYSFDGVKHWVKPESQGLGQSGKVAGRQADQERGWLQHYLGIHGSLESALCHLIIDQVSSCLALSSQNLQESTDLSLLGLDSIAAMQVLSSLSSQLEIRLSPSHYHGMSTPIDLARAILIHHGAELIKTQHPKPISFHSQPIIAPGVELLALEQWSTSNQSAQVQDRSQDFEVLSLLALDKVLKSNSQLQARLLVTLRNRRHMELLIGGSGSTLVFLPAFGMNSSQWHPQFEYFSQNHRVVAVTLPGFGRSQRPEKADFEAMVAMLTEALDRIGASRDINLVGSSFGGLIARKFTQNHPKRVASLTMVNSPLAMEKMPSLESFRTGLAHELMELFDSEQRAIYEHAVDLIDVDYYRQLLQSQAAGDTAGLSLPVPTLIVTGKKDGIQSWEKIEAVFRNQEQVEVQVLEQSGHFPNISHRDDFNHMLGRFVARGEVFEYLPPGTKQLLS